MLHRKKILWLVSWYPNKYNLFDGDFIQRHARAAALHHDVHVLFVKQAEEQNEIENAWKENSGLVEQIIYLPKQRGLYGKLKNYRRWKEQYCIQVRLLVERHRPDLIHVHIPWRVGLVAQWAMKTFSVPYIVTEHWGIYNRVASDNIYTKSVFFRRLLKRIYKDATAFVSVSDYLGQGVNHALLQKDYVVIPNVVDTSLFYPVSEKNERFTFIHVSNMVPLKNIEGILESFKKFLQLTGADAQLMLIGNADDTYPNLAKGMGLLNSSVFFKGEIPYNDVAKKMQRSHVFVLNSNIENSPCVIGEALCCGLPVTASSVGGIPELINVENGLLVQPRDVNLLADALNDMFQNYLRFNTTGIASTATKKFGTEAIGAAFLNLYKSY